MVKGDVIFLLQSNYGDLATGVKDLGNEFATFTLYKSQKVVKSIINIYNKWTQL